MRILLNRPFQRFAAKEGLSDEDLISAIVRANRGLIDADLGGGVIKQRIARPGQGRSGGYRSIVLFRSSERAIFVYGFAKNDRSNISGGELAAFRELATILLAFDDQEIDLAKESEKLREVEFDE